MYKERAPVTDRYSFVGCFRGALGAISSEERLASLHLSWSSTAVSVRGGVPVRSAAVGILYVLVGQDLRFDLGISGCLWVLVCSGTFGLWSWVAHCIRGSMGGLSNGSHNHHEGAAAEIWM